MGLVSDKWAEAAQDVFTVGDQVRVAEQDNGDVWLYDAKVTGIYVNDAGVQTRLDIEHNGRIEVVHPDAVRKIESKEEKENMMRAVDAGEREILVEWVENDEHKNQVMKANKLDKFALDKFREGVDVDKQMHYWTDRHDVKISIQTVPDAPVQRAIK